MYSHPTNNYWVSPLAWTLHGPGIRWWRWKTSQEGGHQVANDTGSFNYNQDIEISATREIPMVAWQCIRQKGNFGKAFCGSDIWAEFWMKSKLGFPKAWCVPSDLDDLWHLQRKWSFSSFLFQAKRELLCYTGLHYFYKAQFLSQLGLPWTLSQGLPSTSYKDLLWSTCLGPLSLTQSSSFFLLWLHLDPQIWHILFTTWLQTRVFWVALNLYARV